MTTPTDQTKQRSWLKALGIAIAVIVGLLVLLGALFVATFSNGFM